MKSTVTETMLHQWEVSPFCGKVRRILAHKGIPYRVRNYNGILTQKAARLSSIGKLPVLDINGERIQDSRRIGAYLEQHFPEQPLIPADPALRAQMEIYQDWADESLYWYNFYFRLEYDAAWHQVAEYFGAGRPAWEKTVVKIVGRVQYRHQLRAQGLGRSDKATVEARFGVLLDALEAALAGREWLVGEHKTLADIAVGSQLHEVVRTSHLAGAVMSRANIGRWLATV